MRRLRDLPWRIRADDPDVAQMIRIGKSSAVYCLTLILIPGVVLMWLVRRRKLDWLAGIGVLVGCGSVGFGLTFGHAEGDMPKGTLTCGSDGWCWPLHSCR